MHIWREEYMENKKASTLAEYAAEVKKHFKATWPNLSDQEIDDYLTGEEAVGVIKNRFTEEKVAFENGNLMQQEFLVGGASAVGYCLAMMY